jgi:hypothetical protein
MTANPQNSWAQVGTYVVRLMNDSHLQIAMSRDTIEIVPDEHGEVEEVKVYNVNGRLKTHSWQPFVIGSLLAVVALLLVIIALGVYRQNVAVPL